MSQCIHVRALYGGSTFPFCGIRGHLLLLTRVFRHTLSAGRLACPLREPRSDVGTLRMSVLQRRVAIGTPTMVRFGDQLYGRAYTWTIHVPIRRVGTCEPTLRGILLPDGPVTLPAGLAGHSTYSNPRASFAPQSENIIFAITPYGIRTYVTLPCRVVWTTVPWRGHCLLGFIPNTAHFTVPSSVSPFTIRTYEPPKNQAQNG